jgi:O-antigen/teichoic acid export membrane protein
MKVNSLRRNTVLLTVAQLSNYIAPLVVLPYLARVLSIESFGSVAILLTLIGVAQIFTDFGFSLAGASKIATIKNSIHDSSVYISTVMYVRMIVSLLVSLLLFVYFIFFNNEVSVTSFILTISFIFISSMQFIFVFQGVERMEMITISNVFSKVAYIISVFLFVSYEDDVELVIFLNLISQLIFCIFSFYCLKKLNYKILKVPISAISYLIKENYLFALSRAAVSLYSRANVLVVAQFSGATQAALYSASEKLYQAGQNSTSPVTQSIFPYMVRTKNRTLLYKLISVIGIFIGLACTISYIYSDEIVTLFYGSKFENASEVLQVLMICLFFNFLSANLGYPAFASFGKLNLCNITVMLGLVAYISSILVVYFILDISVDAYIASLCLLFTELSVLVIRIALLYSLSKKQ